jgi:aryl-alcohol dehydrogenase-like predicted oxidoreductase
LVGTATGIALEEQLGVLEELRQEGKLDLIGLSNVDEAQVRRALELVDVAEIQNLYNILDRRDEAMVDLASEREIALVPFFPLAAGPARLAAEPAIVQIADKHGATATQVALAWLLARYQRMLLIPGTSSVAHLEENMAAVELELDGGELDVLDRVGMDDKS